MLEATNDVLLVKRGESAQIGVTWRDWRTIVGFVEGDAVAQMEETTGHGGAPPSPPPPPGAFALAPLPPTHSMLTRPPQPCPSLPSRLLLTTPFSAGGSGKPGSCAVSDGCCNAVKQFPFGGATPAAASTAAAFQHWRWVIEKSHDGSVSHNRDLFPPRFGLRFSPHLINSDGFTGRALPSATLALRSQAPGGPTRAGRWPRRATATRAAARRAAC